MQKTYAMIDAIGTKTAIHAGRGEEFLDAFHTYLKSWSSDPHDGDGGFLNLQVDARSPRVEKADVRIVALSDTAIVRGGREYVLGDFLNLIHALQRGLEKRGIPSFALICRGDEIQSPGLDIIADSLRTGENQPSYVRAIGTGPVWTNLYSAFHAVESEEFRVWQTKYRLYVVGSDSLPPGMKVIESREIRVSKTDCIDVIAVG